MSDLGRKDFGDKAEEKLTPDSQKSLLDKTKEGLTGAGDKVAGSVQPSDEKSVTQKLSDSTSTKPGEESYLDTAKKTLGEAVEYVEKTAEDVYNKVVESTK
ncbi:MAG: hypothetical protein ALECFALPRED_008891 [Alectoria fallacina]|uniref:Uncharacterized protein n=1 Tax=Alectoria fallacina TaxID=1903189 RepID=A0A8H3PI87_9LECA|nr:MAG: hypothetical protein ALECFALPRED_008891 [Alectoria fallacina]